MPNRAKSLSNKRLRASIEGAKKYVEDHAACELNHPIAETYVMSSEGVSMNCPKRFVTFASALVIFTSLTAVSDSSVAFAQTQKLTLHPNGFGPHSYASWKAKEGVEDSEGDAQMALYLQKMTSTATRAAGIALITGLKGTVVGQLTGLSWEHRVDGHCGAGAPRWNIVVLTASGQRRTLFLGCAAAVHSPGSAPNWIRDSYTGPTTIVGVGAANAGIAPTDIPDIMAGTIQGLQIVFDEGNDVGQGYVFLDNITVEVNGVAHVWTGPMDNGRGPVN